MSKRFGFFGVIVAGIAGLVTGLLTAPKAGKETREDVKVKADELKDRANRALNEAQTTANEKVQETREKADEVVTEARRRAEEVKGEVRSRAEQVKGEVKSHLGQSEDEDAQTTTRRSSTHHAPKHTK